MYEWEEGEVGELLLTRDSREGDAFHFGHTGPRPVNLFRRIINADTSTGYNGIRLRDMMWVNVRYKQGGWFGTMVDVNTAKDLHFKLYIEQVIP